MNQLLTLLILFFLIFYSTPAGGSTLVVGKDYSSISEAIKNARDGDTVLVLPGVYYEHIVVDKRIRIFGIGNVIVDGNFSGTVVSIVKNKVCIENIEVRNSGGCKGDALMEIKGNDCRIRGCKFFNSREGLLILSKFNSIENSSFGRNGIAISVKCSFNKLSSISCRNCGIGIYLDRSKGNRLKKLSFEFDGLSILLEDAEDNLIENFTILYGNENQGGIYLDRSDHNVIKLGKIQGNGFGLRFYESEGNLVENLNLTMNKEGIDLIKTRFNKIRNCNFIKNNLAVHAIDSFLDSIGFSNFVMEKSYGILAKKSFLDARFNYWRNSDLLPVLSFVLLFPKIPFPLNIGCKNVFSKTIDLEEFTLKIKVRNDSDGDGCSDEWEERWGYDKDKWDDHLHLDPDGDGLNNVEECFAERWKANPFKKDIFVEIDRTKDSYVLEERFVERIRRIFSMHNISIHIEGGEVIKERSNLTYPQIIDLYWDHFLHNDMRNPRKGIFRYVIFCSSKPENLGGFCYVGWNTIDAFIISYRYYSSLLPNLLAKHAIATIFLHELGHTLGLFYHTFEGIDNYSCRNMLPGVWKYRNYKSCMNYEYAWFILNYSDGSHGVGDFDDWNSIDLPFFKREVFTSDLTGTLK